MNFCFIKCLQFVAQLGSHLEHVALRNTYCKDWNSVKGCYLGNIFAVLNYAVLGREKSPYPKKALRVILDFFQLLLEWGL